jgi:adenosylhomocysteine nucleosidase
VSGPAAPLPCVVFALRRESLFFRRAYPQRQRVAGAPCHTYFAGPPSRTVLVLETGLGARATGAAVEWLLADPRLDGRPLRPQFVLLAGFSGALWPGRPVGHLILATEVVDEHGRCWPATWPGPLLAEELSPSPERGRILTADELVTDPREKERLGREHGAVAADMESAALARACHRAGVPFGCLRAVSDDVDAALSPALGALLRRGRVAPGALLGAVARSPGLVRELWRLARHTRAAAKTLARGIAGLLASAGLWQGRVPVRVPLAPVPSAPPRRRAEPRSGCGPWPWRG